LGDTNGDNRVDVQDLNAVRNNFGAQAVTVPGLGRIPTKAKDMADMRWINGKGAEIYRYMNFDQIAEYQDVAKTVAA